ncbi:helix-turn-helix domain-containing protein [Flavobacterium sp. MC2016-06]|uniref:helix-turn-helix domain-containing protein n=1 Tax=Flavobacterium sp. MC2016-06 TaxID=2676308 RepID=UPI0012BAFC66|nr:helix-turn-helix domain-containing protein [Flavobacterium sp. MC2016-06]MBU3858218.1 helix-turn-helix domain-containing protein [Flavobacterium sp. MC2016-06]
MIPFVFEEKLTSENHNDIMMLFDKPVFQSLAHPVKLDVTICVICLNGQMKGSSNMRHFETEQSCLLILLAEHTITIDSVSDDFSGLFIIMTRKFADTLDIEERLPVFLALHKNPCIPLNENELISLKGYFNMVHRVLYEIHNPFAEKIVRHLTKAFFYALSYNIHQISQYNNEGKKSRQEEMVGKFLNDVRDNFKVERGIEFYAAKLYVTPKYLSKVVKEHNGLSAKKWIEDYVVWEAKALLKSTDRTIQQISEELNFPSQSFFGKFFKRSAGLSPFEYRKS